MDLNPYLCDLPTFVLEGLQTLVNQNEDRHLVVLINDVLPLFGYGSKQKWRRKSSVMSLMKSCGIPYLESKGRVCDFENGTSEVEVEMEEGQKPVTYRVVCPRLEPGAINSSESLVFVHPVDLQRLAFCCIRKKPSRDLIDSFVTLVNCDTKDTRYDLLSEVTPTRNIEYHCNNLPPKMDILEKAMYISGIFDDDNKE